uniref:Doublecortin domain-containing protein n=1 Tax=Panagrolaimus davidi TaxID=227884 RepID=A0A914QXC8_9BILA
MDIDAVEKHQQKMREIAQKRWEKFNEQQQQQSGSSARILLNNDKWKSRTLGLFLPLRAKQLFFILNGNPGRIYRVIINPYRKFDFDTILEEISHGLGIAIWKLYSFTGERIKNAEELFDIKENRVLAVPRHERPIFPTGIHKESSASSVASAAITSLPPINRSNLFHHQQQQQQPSARQPFVGRTTTTHYALKLPARQPAVRNNHSIERSPIGRDSRIPVAPAAIVPARRTFSYHKPAEARPFVPQMASTSRARVAPPIQPFTKGAQNRRVMSLKPRRTLPYEQASRIGLPASTLLAASAAKPSTTTSKGSSTASASVEDSDSGRPRSTDFEEATEDQSESDSDNALKYEEEETDDDDYPDVHSDILSQNDSLESPPPSRASNGKILE